KNAQGEIIGAIGVSGSTVENDHTVAEAGASAI
ncbi:MAG: heme-binding protein, partial [Soonwooa sp.]